MKSLALILISLVLFTGCDDFDQEYTVFHEGNLDEWTPEKVFGGVKTYQATNDTPLKIENYTDEQKQILNLINDYRTGVKKCDGKRYNFKPLVIGKDISRFSDKLAKIMIDGKFSFGTKKGDKDIAEDARKSIKYYPHRYSATFSYTNKSTKEAETVLEDAIWTIEHRCKHYNKNANYKWVGISLFETGEDQTTAILAGY